MRVERNGSVKTPVNDLMDVHAAAGAEAGKAAPDDELVEDDSEVGLPRRRPRNPLESPPDLVKTESDLSVLSIFDAEPTPPLRHNTFLLRGDQSEASTPVGDFLRQRGQMRPLYPQPRSDQGGGVQNGGDQFVPEQEMKMHKQQLAQMHTELKKSAQIHLQDKRNSRSQQVIQQQQASEQHAYPVAGQGEDNFASFQEQQHQLLQQRRQLHGQLQGHRRQGQGGKITSNGTRCVGVSRSIDTLVSAVRLWLLCSKAWIRAKHDAPPPPSEVLNLTHLKDQIQ